MQLLKWTAAFPQNGPCAVSTYFLTLPSTTTAETLRANKLRYVTTLTKKKKEEKKKVYLGPNVRICHPEFKDPMDRKGTGILPWRNMGAGREKILRTTRPCPCFGQDFGNCSQSSRLQRRYMYNTQTISREDRRTERPVFSFSVITLGSDFAGYRTGRSFLKVNCYQQC